MVAACAALALACGDSEGAAYLSGASDACSHSHLFIDRFMGERVAAGARARLDAAVFSARSAAGRDLSVGQAVDEALAWLWAEERPS